jgi:putative ABC transport system permease protein
MLRTPPFLKAPLLLFRHRVVFGAVLGAAVILGLVVALTPQYLSSASSAALERELGGRCDTSINGFLGLAPGADPLSGGGRRLGVNEGMRERLSRDVADQDHVDEPRATVIGHPVQAVVRAQSDTQFPLVLLHRDGYQDRLEVLDQTQDEGVWVDEFVAEQYGLEIGDILDTTVVIPMDVGTDRVIERSLSITGITEDHANLSGLDFWCGVSHLIGFTPGGDRRPPVGLVDLAHFSTKNENEPGEAQLLRRDEYWELPVEHRGLTLNVADEILETFALIGEGVFFDPTGVRSDLGIVRNSMLTLHIALATSVRPLAIAVMAAAFGLMAGAGSYWVDRRRQELRLLAAMGFGPSGIGVKATLEMMVPVVAGVGMGSLLSIAVVAWAGPGGVVEPAARQQGLLSALPTAGLALLLVGVVAAAKARRLLSPPPQGRSSTWWTLPLAALLAVGAYLLRRVIGDEAVTFGENALVGTVDPLVILFPLLMFAAVALVAAELILLVVPRLKDRFGANSFYMASRRLASSPGPVVVVLAGALIPVAILVYSTALTRSAETSVQVKGRVFIGSDVRAPVFGFDALPPELVDASTYVSRAERVEIEGIEVDFQVVDPDTFVSGAFWDDSFSDQSLDELLELVDQPGTPLPAIVANAGMDIEGGFVDLGQIEIPVEFRASASGFPGARGSRPIITVGRTAFDEYVAEQEGPPGSDGTITYLWAKGLDAATVERALGEANIGYSFTTTVAEALDLTKFQVIIWTFDFLKLYAALSGLIAISAILLYADTRQRARNLSYALALRMGLTRREHLQAGMIEIGGLVLVGAVTGSLVAHLAARWVYLALDGLPATPPPPRWVGTIDLIVLLALLSVGVGWLASAAAQRTADNADVSELLRHGD